MTDRVEEIRRAINLTELISDFTTVRRNRAACPFHADRTPSLTISESKGLWHCFGCHAGGDIYSFLMMAEGISFTEAVSRLADRAGIHIKNLNKKDRAHLHNRIKKQKMALGCLNDEKRRRTESLKKDDEFLAGLWKRTNAGSWPEKEKILEDVEACFIEIERKYEEIERWYQNESRKVYGQALHQEC